MLTIKDILHIPYPEEQKELKPGYTVFDFFSLSYIELDYSNFSECRNYPIEVKGKNFKINGVYSREDNFPSLIVIDVPKVLKKIRLAPALLQRDRNAGERPFMFTEDYYLPFRSTHCYDSFKQAREMISSDVKIIWPAPPIGPDGFYEFSEEDWK